MSFLSDVRDFAKPLGLKLDIITSNLLKMQLSSIQLLYYDNAAAECIYLLELTSR